ncbi:MAG TPA: M48 family metallopeptidase [Gammaproteobacteria bacterium]|nr:M48 family metallopeptidase [Gammaproteobacteria bacterium]
MPTFTLIFLCTLGLSLIARLWLAQRHINHVQSHRTQVPAAFNGRISLEAHRKAADYTIAKTRFGTIDAGLDTILLLLWTLGGGLNLVDQAWRSLSMGRLTTGIAVFLSVLLISAVIELPATIYRTFVLEKRFGFNRTTVATFVTDLIKNAALLLIIGAPLIFVVLWLMQGRGDYWWLYVWAVWTACGLLLTWAYPTLIAPFFNRFSPLQNEALRSRIQALLARCGFQSKGVYIMDGSKRSAHGNAYFTGFGRNKRIVFFDTLMDTLSSDEIESVLAHELGHFKRNHVKKRLLFMAIYSLVALFVLAWLMRQPWFYGALGVDEPSVYMALLLFMMVAPVFGFFLRPLIAWWSRKHEFEADEFAAGQSGARSLITALVSLYKENASTLTPDPLHSAVYDSHPPAAIRIARLNEYAGST